jgi:DNA-binding MarR family transcriptional regulator
LKHNSTVELVDRSEREGLLTRKADADDGRRAILQLTRKGRQVLGKLSDDHARELREMAPRLIAALEKVRSHTLATVSEAQAAHNRNKRPGFRRAINVGALL